MRYRSRTRGMSKLASVERAAVQDRRRVEKEGFGPAERSGNIWTTTHAVDMQQSSHILLTITVLRDILSIDDTLDIIETSAIHSMPNASELEPYSANNKTHRRRSRDRP